MASNAASAQDLTDEPAHQAVPAWGKYRDESNFHLLEHHCADVAAVFEALLCEPVLHSRFERAAGIDLCLTTEARLAACVFLHDFGKLNSGFQFKPRKFRRSFSSPPAVGHIEAAFLCCRHTQTWDALGLRQVFDLWGSATESLLLAALSHHGRPPSPSSRTGSGPPKIWQPFGGYDPREAAVLLNERLKSWFPEAFGSGPKLPDSPALAHLFAGITALADQVGSDENFFPFASDPDPGYMARARKLASVAVNKKGFRRAERIEKAQPAGFSEIFGHKSPRPLQQEIQAVPLDCQLVILESETGSGKTEAAVMRFEALWRAGLVDGLYFAVPTRASAKQLQRRVDGALQNIFQTHEDWAKTLLAVPGCERVGEAEIQERRGYMVYWEDCPDEEQRKARWAAESMRHYLNYTAAVGTVDQALLGSLKVKWAHLRSAALARSLLVVDEVHASDFYMTELLQTLLRGHLRLGGHALLMSATLGARARAELSSFFSGDTDECLSLEGAVTFPYPAITMFGVGKPHQQQEIAGNMGQKDKRVSIELKPWMDDTEEVARLALKRASQGAKVLVIRNTVSAAQEVFQKLLNHGDEELLFSVSVGEHRTPTLHHSRFSVEDRKLLDEAVEQVLGKSSPNQKGVVVVGTQTLEQSLDIDADFLISDLCPADVLLQRIGRLHRHKLERPLECTTPCCLVLEPSEDLANGLDGALLRYGLGKPEKYGGIYRNLLVVKQTALLIESMPEWNIPSMNRKLVELATHHEALQKLAEELGGEWLAHGNGEDGLVGAERGNARNHALNRNEDFCEQGNFPDLDQEVRTRLGEDGPRVRLSREMRGAFGAPVQEFCLPAHLVRGKWAKEDIEAAQCEYSSSGNVIFRVGNKNVFIYNKMGVKRIDDPEGT